jgi:hypothetical protein
MRRFIAAATLLLAPSLFAHDHNQNVSINTDGSDDVTSCSQIRVSFDHADAVRAEEELPVANLRALKIVSDQRGGVRVTGWDQPRYAVTVCKAAAASDVLRDIHVELRGNEVVTTGPESKQWVVQLLVRTPRNATLDVNTHNGPTSFHHVNGTLAVRSQNGPVSLKDTSGTIDVAAVNGPIALAGGSGNVKITATNGPLSVKLAGARWDGTLHGTTTNGPVSLKIPKNFGSGVDLTVEGHGPISCRADACRDAKRSWDDRETPRQLSFGSGPHNVTLSTVNGPVVVKEAE